MDLQHPMHMHEGPLGIPEARMGSGTAWLPDASPMHAAHVVLGDWTLMLHGVGFLQYDRQGGSRGSNQIGLVTWELPAATGSRSGGRLQLRGMLGAERWTAGSRGYSLLVQSGGSYVAAPRASSGGARSSRLDGSPDESGAGVGRTSTTPAGGSTPTAPD